MARDVGGRGSRFRLNGFAISSGLDVDSADVTAGLFWCVGGSFSRKTSPPSNVGHRNYYDDLFLGSARSTK